jgi:hypothetical protein
LCIGASRKSIKDIYKYIVHKFICTGSIATLNPQSYILLCFNRCFDPTSDQFPMQSPLSRILCRGQTTTGDPHVVVSWFGVAWTPSMTPQTKAQGGSLRSNCRDCDCMRHNARADYCTFGFRRPLAEHSSAGLRSSDDRIVHVARHGVWIRGYALRNYWERVVFVCA